MFSFFFFILFIFSFTSYCFLFFFRKSRFFPFTVLILLFLLFDFLSQYHFFTCRLYFMISVYVFFFKSASFANIISSSPFHQSKWLSDSYLNKYGLLRHRNTQSIECYHLPFNKTLFNITNKCHFFSYSIYLSLFCIFLLYNLVASVIVLWHAEANLIIRNIFANLIHKCNVFPSRQSLCCTLFIHTHSLEVIYTRKYSLSKFGI